jgi:hypothetical protein
MISILRHSDASRSKSTSITMTTKAKFDTENKKLKKL